MLFHLIRDILLVQSQTISIQNEILTENLILLFLRQRFFRFLCVCNVQTDFPIHWLEFFHFFPRLLKLSISLSNFSLFLDG